MNAIPDTTVAWSKQLAQFPYVQYWLPFWQVSDATEPNRVEYEQALQEYLDAREIHRALVERHNRLRSCRQRLEMLQAKGDHHPANLLLLGRVQNDLGERLDSFNCFESLFAEKALSEPSVLNRPFLPPLASFEQIQSEDDTWMQWLEAALLEALELTSALSTYTDPTSHLSRLSALHGNPYRSLTMETRLALCALNLGKSVVIRDDSRLLNRANRNSETWHKIANIYTAPKHSRRSIKIPPKLHIDSNLSFPIADAQYQKIELDRSIQILINDQQVLDIQLLGHTDYTLLGRSLDGQWFVKIELQPHPLKRNTLLEEAEIIQILNKRGCVTCPSLRGIGYIQASKLTDLLQLPKLNEKKLPALILPYLSSQSSVDLPDLLLTIEEQRKLGWFHADIKPDNLRFCPETKVCYLIDYDQAEPLYQEQINQPLVDFLRWADQRVREKYARFQFNGLFNYFSGITVEQDILPRLDKGRLDLGKTQLFRSSETTLNPSKIYHCIDLPDAVAHGERNLDDRLRLLNYVPFFKGERVLDIGCNAGLLCAYLANRDCIVKGIDLDPYVIRGARILSNIRGDNIEFDCADLDQINDLGHYDTIMLFSVLHHTQKVSTNAKLIANSCDRIIIECRLCEQGAKPVDGNWIATTAWSYDDISDLIKGLNKLFPDFQFFKNHGQADRNRYILEFVKQNKNFAINRDLIKSTNEALQHFLFCNNQRWSKIQPKHKDQYILVEFLVGHPGYFIANAVLAKYLQQIYGCAIKAILPNRENKYMYALAESYGITDFYYEEDINKMISIKHKLLMLETLKMPCDLRKTLLAININGIAVGDLIYDMYLRNTGGVTVEVLDDQLLSTAINAIGYYQLYDSIFSLNSVIATVVGHTVYTRFGILARVSVSHNVPVYAKKPNPLAVKKYLRLEDFPDHETSINKLIFEYFFKNYRQQLVKKGLNCIKEQINSEASSVAKNGSARWYSESYGKNKRMYSKESFCKATGIDCSKPIVILFSHCMPDAPHSFPFALFEDYYQWLTETLKYISDYPEINWIVKPHPDDKYYNSKISAEQIYQRFAHLSHIALAPPDINNKSLFKFTHAIVTVAGTAGLEFASQGIPVILAGQSTYSGLEFTHEPKSIKEYYELLSNIQALKPLDTEAVDRAHALIAMQLFYIRASCLYMPDMPLTPWESYEESKIFQQSGDKAQKYEFSEDPFFRSFLLQVIMNSNQLFNYEEL